MKFSFKEIVHCKVNIIIQFAYFQVILSVYVFQTNAIWGILNNTMALFKFIMAVIDVKILDAQMKAFKSKVMSF